MKSLNMMGTGVALLGLAGCASLAVAPPSEIRLNEQPFTITVPKSLNSSNSLLKGVNLGSFTNTGGKRPIRKFYSMSFKEDKNNSELVTEACKGDLHDNGLRYQSCIYFDSKVLVTDAGDSYKIEIKPYRKRLVQGKNAVFLPIALPVADVNKWNEWISKQTVSVNSEYSSKYSSESIKGNFDRNLSKYTWRSGESDAASKQFKDTYALSIDDANVKIGVSIFPYKNGSIAKTRIMAKYTNLKKESSIDWQTILKNVNNKLDDVVNQ